MYASEIEAYKEPTMGIQCVEDSKEGMLAILRVHPRHTLHSEDAEIFFIPQSKSVAN